MAEMPHASTQTPPGPAATTVSPAHALRSSWWTAGALLALVLAALALASRPDVPGLGSLMLWNVEMPRAAVAILAGAALGLSGALLQRVLRNPIADPSTLGIAAGAQLALTIALAFAPALAGAGREVVALIGGATAAGIVVALGWRRGLDPVTVVLSGMMISLVAGALSATLILAKGDYVLSLTSGARARSTSRAGAAPPPSRRALPSPSRRP